MLRVLLNNLYSEDEDGISNLNVPYLMMLVGIEKEQEQERKEPKMKRNRTYVREPCVTGPEQSVWWIKYLKPSVNNLISSI